MTWSNATGDWSSSCWETISLPRIVVKPVDTNEVVRSVADTVAFCVDWTATAVPPVIFGMEMLEVPGGIGDLLNRSAVARPARSSGIQSETSQVGGANSPPEPP